MKSSHIIFFITTLFLFGCGGGSKNTDNKTTQPSVIANKAPITNAGVDQSVSEQTIVKLNGTATDSDGSISNIEWSQVSGSTVTINNKNSLSATFTAPVTIVEIQLEFKISVTDNDGSTAEEKISITVIPVNITPQANAGENQVVADNIPFNLSGNASTDEDGEIVEFVWLQTAGVDVVLENNSQAEIQITPPIVSETTTLEFELTVIDNEGALNTDKVLITLFHQNIPPISDAGIEQIFDENTEAQLSGASSSDVDGTIVKYLWTQESGPEIYPGTNIFSNNKEVIFTTPHVAQDTEFTFKLTVEDNEGASAEDFIKVTVKNISNIIVNVDDLNVNDQQLVEIHGTGYSDSGLSTSSIWSQISGADVNISVGEFEGQPSMSFLVDKLTVDAQYGFRLTVTSNDGLETVFDDTLVTVNASPTIVLSENNTFPEQTEVKIDASNSYDTSSNNLTYFWELPSGNDTRIVNPNDSTLTFTAPTVLQANDIKQTKNLFFDLTVKDELGAESKQRVFVYIESVNVPPTIESSNITSILAGHDIDLNATASDVDGEVFRTTWELDKNSCISGTFAGDINSDSITFTPSYSVFGLQENCADYAVIFNFIAEDNEFSKSTETIKVLLNYPYSPTVHPYMQNSFSKEILGGIVATGINNIKILDYDFDGDIDLIFAFKTQNDSILAVENGQGYARGISWLENKSGVFGEPQSIYSSPYMFAYDVGLYGAPLEQYYIDNFDADDDWEIIYKVRGNSPTDTYGVLYADKISEQYTENLIYNNDQYLILDLFLIDSDLDNDKDVLLDITRNSSTNSSDIIQIENLSNGEFSQPQNVTSSANINSDITFLGGNELLFKGRDCPDGLTGLEGTLECLNDYPLNISHYEYNNLGELELKQKWPVVETGYSHYGEKILSTKNALTLSFGELNGTFNRDISFWAYEKDNNTGLYIENLTKQFDFIKTDQTVHYESIDLNNDDISDYVVFHNKSKDIGDHPKLYLSNDSGGYNDPITIPFPLNLIYANGIPDKTITAVPNINNKNDLLINTFNNLILFDGINNYQTYTLLNPTSSDFNNIDIEDVDKNGQQDILFVSPFEKRVGLIKDFMTDNPVSQIVNFNIENATSAKAVDIDNDGDIDLIVSSSWDELTGADRISGAVEGIYLLEMANTGEYKKEVLLFKGSFDIENLIFGDINGDDLPDLLWLDGNAFPEMKGCYFAINKGNLAFESAALLAPTGGCQAHSIELVDLDNDSDLDVLAHTTSPNSIDNNSSIFWYENDGAGVFSQSMTINTNPALRINFALAGDIDNDGDIDLVAHQLMNVDIDGTDFPQDACVRYINDGNQEFTMLIKDSLNEPVNCSRNIQWNPYIHHIKAQLIDINNDNFLDIVTSNGSYSLNNSKGDFGTSLLLYNQNGINSENEPFLYPKFTMPFDVDGDGDLDIIMGARNKIVIKENKLD